MFSFNQAHIDTRQQTVLLIDDDKDMRWAISNILSAAGFAVAEAETGGIGLKIAGATAPDTVLLDMRMPGINGEEVLRKLHNLDPALPVIIITAHGTISGAVSAVRDGAFEYITKPFRNEHLLDAVKRAIARREIIRSTTSGLESALLSAMGQSSIIRKLIAQINAVLSTDYSVVIQGETGAGKEVVARSLHRFGRRAARPLAVVDCGAITESLIDSEFFGHERGAFTGAVERRKGSFEGVADGGTIFLDEIGNLPTSGQKALLRTLEERKIRRVGGSEVIDLDMRVIAATNDDLRERARAGSFRQDLFFRLSEYLIVIPPLRSRIEDLEFLARRFLAQARDALGRGPADIDPTALDLLRDYHWPGNVRELRNIMRRVALAPSDIVTPKEFSGLLGDDCACRSDRHTEEADATLRHRVQRHVREFERDAIIHALEQAGGNKAKAARLLGIDYKTYRIKLKLLETQREGTQDA